MGGSQHKHTHEIKFEPQWAARSTDTRNLILNRNGQLATQTHAQIKIGSAMGGPYSNTRIYFRNKIAKSVIAKKALTRDQMCTKRTNFSLENHQRLLRLIRIQLQYAAASY